MYEDRCVGSMVWRQLQTIKTVGNKNIYIKNLKEMLCLVKNTTLHFASIVSKEFFVIFKKLNCLS